MRPLIGITCAWEEERERFYLSDAYVRAVEAAGGLPVPVPCTGAAGAAPWLEVLDGLILSGGGDVDPFYFGEEPLLGCGEVDPRRDAFELELVRGALCRRLPLLGICRGLQVVNIAAGGDIYQDIYRQVPGCLKHRQDAPRWAATHGVEIKAGTRLARLLGAGNLRVNSFHHQAVRRVAPGLVVAACAPDGLIEALEGAGPGFVLGVQWHPEAMWEKDRRFLALFAALVEAGRRYRLART
ncbi:gamma-glutamyl-gamma-aminobutyrate hydrolase family protein [Desulfovirgula thermocuniculi]|uniref:gamma-glutamyl-gamma-aminobutyrate hydrolase family protein n=1 Tax=Desulfovirgula thermocuniculi TaxID=348842 RepID=UPI0004096F32|nr:gamma-glutamyl-gamma-aminobutyrate hydrolase family protein [Desulfovirgula thermocuniculi]